MARRKQPPTWTPDELDIVRTGWPAGVSMDDLLRQLPERTPRGIQLKAYELRVCRPDWFTKEARSLGGQIGAMVRQGRRNFWSVDATTRLLTVTKESGVEAAAKACRVTVEQAKGRLYRIGYRFTDEKPPEPVEEPESGPPPLPCAERIAALVAQFEQSTKGARQHGTQAHGR